jgi:hypothetical protein
MEQPCWYEDCPLLVRAPIKLHLLLFCHYELMLTSAPQGPGYEGTITRFTHLICHLYPEPPFRILYLYRTPPYIEGISMYLLSTVANIFPYNSGAWSSPVSPTSPVPPRSSPSPRTLL